MLFADSCFGTLAAAIVRLAKSPVHVNVICSVKPVPRSGVFTKLIFNQSNPARTFSTHILNLNKCIWNRNMKLFLDLLRKSFTVTRLCGFVFAFFEPVKKSKNVFYWVTKFCAGTFRLQQELIWKLTILICNLLRKTSLQAVENYIETIFDFDMSAPRSKTKLEDKKRKFS